MSASPQSARGVAIRIQDVSLQFGAYAALSHISLDIRPGELIALLGPSGSGKTTLLRVIAGLQEADSGRVLFDDTDTSQLSVQERRVGFVFQSYALFKHMTVAANVGYGLRARPRAERPSSGQIASKVEELLSFVQLKGLGSRYPAQLSGGQRQRVALARSLAIEPRVLLLDEPFGALDAQVRKDLRRWLRQVHRDTGLTTVFVTHDQDEAMDLADRVVVLKDGKIEQVGKPEDLYDNPASPFVISFIGEAVALPVNVAGGRASYGGRDLNLQAAGLPDGDARIYFRPADIALSGADGPTVDGVVEHVRRTPTGLRATVTIPGFDKVLEVDAKKDEHPKEGQVVPLALSRAKLFGAEGKGVVRGQGEGI